MSFRTILLMICCTWGAMFVTTATVAATFTTYCNGCTAVQEELHVENVTPYGGHVTFLFDFVENQMRKFQSIGGIGDDHALGNGYAELAPTSTELDAADAMQTLWDNHAKTESANVPPSTGYDSAYDVIGNGAAQQDLGLWISNNPGNFLWTALHQVGNFFTVPFEFEFYITLYFSDGSRMTFEIDERTEEFVAAEDTARDSDGNFIPRTASDMAGTTYVFPNGTNSTNFENWFDRAGDLGVPIVDPNGQSSSGTVRFTCPGGDLPCAPGDTNDS